jgi:hypothetical protein
MIICGHHQVSIRKYGGSALWDWYGYVTMVRSQYLLCLLYATVKGHGKGGGRGRLSVMCAILGCIAQVYLSNRPKHVVLIILN